MSLFDFIDNLQNSESLKTEIHWRNERTGENHRGWITYGDEYIGNKTPLLDAIGVTNALGRVVQVVDIHLPFFCVISPAPDNLYLVSYFCGDRLRRRHVAFV